MAQRLPIPSGGLSARLATQDATVPGIVGFAEASPEAVQAACLALKRRPFHRVQLVEDPTAGVSIGVVSEQGSLARDEATGIVVAVDGEFAGTGGWDAETPAAELLRRYVDDGAAFQPPEGWFAAAIYDPRAQAFVLVTDRVGQRPLYVARCGHQILVAGELKALTAAGFERRLDPVAWAQLLAYEMTLGDQTPLVGVRLVPPASTLEVPLKGSPRLHRRWRFRLEPAADGDHRELVEELGRLTARAVAARIDDDTVLALSGGLDSRTMLSTVLDRTPRPLLVSYGAPGSEDLRLAGAVAAAVRFPHCSIPLDAGYLARGAAETVWLAEGSIRCLHAHHLVLRSVRDAHAARSVLIGFAGDPILRAFPNHPREGGAKLAAGLHRNLASSVSDDLVKELLTPSFAVTLRGLALDSLRTLLEEEEGDEISRVRQFVWNQGQRRKVLPGALLFGDDLAPRDPFADGDLIEFCRCMPERLRQGGVLQRAYLSGFPELASVTNPKDGVSPRLGGRRRQLALSGVKARRHLHGRVDDAVGFRWLPNRRGLGDYARELRTHSHMLLDILFEARTLARGQLNEKGVERLVRELSDGRRRNTRPLGMLLTLELFQRQFIDGDCPEGAGFNHDLLAR
jgi:asparagine synthase (glutamine-hydrolysing)